MAPHSSILAWKIPGRRSLVGCSPRGCEESDTTERLHFHFSLSNIGEGNGNPLQSSCLENPRDGRACWAAVYGAAQSRIRLKWLSSSSNTALNPMTGNFYSALSDKLESLVFYTLYYISDIGKWVFYLSKWPFSFQTTLGFAPIICSKYWNHYIISVIQLIEKATMVFNMWI